MTIEPTLESTPRATKPHARRNKVIATGVAGLALFGGSIAFALGTGGVASASTTAESALTQDASGNHGIRSWFKEHRKALRAEAGKTISSTIGIPIDELRQDLRDGQSVSEIATAHQVDPQTVADALVAQADTALDQAVTDGKLTQERADQAKAKVPEVVGKVINWHKGDLKARADAAS